MKKFTVILFSLFASVGFVACSESRNLSTASTNTNASSSSVASTSNMTMDSGGGGGGGGRKQITQQISLEQAGSSQTPPPAVERKILRNADLTLEADSPDEARAKITTIAESKGGFVIESQKQSSDARGASKTDVVIMTARVPAAKFDESLEEIRKSANRIVVESVKGEDVTEEFIDIEARLKAQKALEAQFLEIMKQAKTVEDALNVQSEIAGVRGEIEKIEGRKRFLENQSSFSTIKIRLQSPTRISGSSNGFFYQIRESIASGFDVALSFTLGLISFAIALLPFLIFIALPFYLVLRYFLKKSRKHKLASEIAQAEIRNE